jgi:hypothetical protein
MRKIGIAPTHGTELEHIRKKRGNDGLLMGCLSILIIGNDGLLIYTIIINMK